MTFYFWLSHAELVSASHNKDRLCEGQHVVNYPQNYFEGARIKFGMTFYFWLSHAELVSASHNKDRLCEGQHVVNYPQNYFEGARIKFGMTCCR
jgi:hypothetical protein